MHFILLTQYYVPEPGAASLRLQAMAKQLTDHGHKVTVVTAHAHHLGATREVRGREAFFMKEVIEGIPVVRAWIWRVPTGRFWLRLANYFSFVVTSFVALMRQSRPDYVIVESPPLFLGITAWIYKRLLGVPYIVSVSDLWPESAVALGLVKNATLIRITRALEHALYKNAAFASAVTEGIQEGILETGKIAAERILFFPNGVDTTIFYHTTPDTALVHRVAPNNEKVFLYPGTMGYAQGLDIVIDAAQYLRHRTDISFLLVGDGPVREHLKQRVVELGLMNVIFEPLQPVDRMPQYFSLARATVVPLKKHRLFRGARPSKVFPAWAAGTPVIYCGEGEMAHLIEEAQGGLVVPPEDGRGLATAVQTLADMDYREWNTMSHHGYSYVVENYTWDIIADRWLAALDQGKS